MTACAVVLAAGAGSRFGDEVKQLASFGGKPLVGWALSAANDSRADRVVLVLGANASAVRAAVEVGRAEVIECRGWSDGMSASLRCGVAACADAEWVVIVLGDGPLLSPDAIDAVLAAARSAPAEVGAVRVTRGERPSHPVALRRSLFGAIERLQGDEGARAVLEGAVVLELDGSAWPDPGDADTPEALAELQRRRTP